MTTWGEFTEKAPRIADIFSRRLAATGNLCMLASLRPDGFPRISPMEPRIFEEQMWLAGMPGTKKFADLDQESRFALHTATTDSDAPDGDAKIWGTVEDDLDRDLHRRFADHLLAEAGHDLRRHVFDHFFKVNIVGAAAVLHERGQMYIIQWRQGKRERRVHKS